MLTNSSPAGASAEDLLSASAGAITLAVIIPTFNEAGNWAELLMRLELVLAGVAWEAIFVDDDSPDGTAGAIQALARRNPRVRCLRRVGRRGLSSACVEGMLATGAPYLAVMDADLQHDEALLPAMLQILTSEPVDLVVGSRYVEGGGVGDWAASRRQASTLATRLGQRLLGLSLRDPMSGFFMIRREAFEATVDRLSSIGFKILADLVASSPAPLRIRELPYRFRERHAGESKFDGRVVWDYLMLLVDKTIGRYIPTRLVSFAAIGSMGLVVHLAVLRLLLGMPRLDFVSAQALAVGLAMVFNFLLNNALTYRDQRLEGRAWLGGLLKFMAACGLGAVANVGVAAYLHHGRADWVVPALAGVLVGTVWNYGATAYLVWRRPKARASAVVTSGLRPAVPASPAAVAGTVSAHGR